MPIFKANLDFSVIERVNQVLTNTAKTWGGISIDELLQLMKDEFGFKQTDVANVLKQFGPKVKR